MQQCHETLLAAQKSFITAVKTYAIQGSTGFDFACTVYKPERFFITSIIFLSLETWRRNTYCVVSVSVTSVCVCDISRYVFRSQGLPDLTDMFHCYGLKKMKERKGREFFLEIVVRFRGRLETSNRGQAFRKIKQ